MFNINENKEDALALVRKIQGMSFEEVKELVKTKSEIKYGCIVSYYILNSEVCNGDSLNIYMQWSLEDKNRTSDDELWTLTENIGLLQVGMHVTVHPTREELLENVKWGNVKVSEKNIENEKKILEACAKKFMKINVNDIDNFFSWFQNVEYKWEVFTTSQEKYDWNSK